MFRQAAPASTIVNSGNFLYLSIESHIIWVELVERIFGEEVPGECHQVLQTYNVFVFGSYITTSYRDGQSDIDIAIYSEDFNLYKRLALYLEEYFRARKIESDIFYIDPAMEAPVYCAPLNSKVQFTDFYPDKLVDLKKRCHQRLEEMKARMVG